MRPRVLILTAIKMEAAAIARKFKLRAPRGSGCTEINGSRFPAELFVIGLGAIRVPELSGRPVSGIILAGLGGAIDPSLPVGEVVVDQSSTWKLSRLPYRRVRFHTVEGVVYKPEQKAQLFAQTGAGVVEMESTEIRRLAKEYNIPFLGIRAISDAAGDSIDPKVLRFIDEYGSPRIADLIGEFFQHPSILGKLSRLRKSAATALEGLAIAVKQIVNPPQ